jgi:Ca2+-dependent lipid-binding protein
MINFNKEYNLNLSMILVAMLVSYIMGAALGWLGLFIILLVMAIVIYTQNKK